MKKIFALFITFVMVLGISCTKDITRFNKDTKHFDEVPGETLFSNAVKQYVDLLASSNVNRNIFRFVIGHWAATTYQDEPRYNYTTRKIPDNLWNIVYRDVLANLEEAKKVINEDVTITDAEKKNKITQADIMQVCGYYFLTTTYGDVPYSEAGDPNQPFPKYDDAATVFGKLITRLQADVTALDDASGGITADQDIIYSGDVALWKKFGNSLLLRLAMTIADSDPQTAKDAFVAANDGAFSLIKENAQMSYKNEAVNANPLWIDLVQSGRQDMIGAAPLIDQLKDLNDGRLDLYFRPNNAGVQVGGVVGNKNAFSLFSKPSLQMIDPTFPQIIMGLVEVEFLRAEAVERNFGISGTAREYYDAAIKASYEWWGGTEQEASDYIAQPDVNYATASGDWVQKIGFQKWIGLYNQPLQGWVEMRRLGVPGTNIVPLPVSAVSGFPNRLQYPQGEQQLNPDNYKSAASAIGGDEVETKLWFDKN